MQERTLRELQNLRPNIRQRWETLLRAEPVVSPLGQPDTLVFLMDWTLDRFFEALNKTSGRRRSHSSSTALPCAGDVHACPCGMNPLLAYFKSAECALIECTLPLLQPAERELYLGEVIKALQVVARREIETFCAVCQRRPATVQQAANYARGSRSH